MQGTAVRPNILYIMCDDHSMQTISAYGSAISKLAPTPNIDRLARRGMLFRSAFVENSLSTPSRACLITGLYSHQNGQRQLGEGIDTTRTFFSELLQQAGYTTGMVGKWHMHCRPKGFDFYHILNNQGTYYNPVFCTTGEYGKYKQEKGYATTLITDHAINFLEHRDKSKPFCLLVHHKAPHRNWMPEEKYMGLFGDVVFPLPKTFWDDYATRGSAARTQKMRVDDDLRMIQDLKVPETLDPNDVESMDSYYALLGETNRFTPEQRVAFDKYYMPRNRKFLEANLKGRALVEWKYQNYIRDYAAVIRSVDDNVGRLLDYLEQNGLSDNTIVVYTSDQGFYMGEHGWFDKRFMYEESFHTPLIISYPGHIKEGAQCHQLVQNIDFAPTFLALAGVKKPAEMSGRSLQPLFKGDRVKNWRKDLYYHYYDYPTYHLVRKHDGVRNDRYKLIHFYGKGSDRAVQENKYQRTPGTGEYYTYQALKKINYFRDDADIDYYELYDLQTDPDELNNIYGKPGTEKVTKQLLKRLADYRKTLKVDE
ncbi:sulfatase [Hoylesella shahii]|uniref:sulfatase family protein n=1 Tax=Hoylesella shahii TaxID=228603 RepID=UPI0028E3B1B7|nr:sulfatase [Hoylesella shahii]